MQNSVFYYFFFILLWWHAGHTHTWFACQDSLKHSLTIKWVFTIGVGVKFTPLIRLGFNGLIEIRFSSYGNWRIYKEKRTPSRLNRVTSVRLFSVTEQTVGTRCHKTEQKQKGDARKNRHFGFVRLAVFGDFFLTPIHWDQHVVLIVVAWGKHHPLIRSKTHNKESEFEFGRLLKWIFHITTCNWEFSFA